MRTLLSILVICSLLTGSLPVFAQEISEPEPLVETTVLPTPEPVIESVLEVINEPVVEPITEVLVEPEIPTVIPLINEEIKVEEKVETPEVPQQSEPLLPVAEPLAEQQMVEVTSPENAAEITFLIRHGEDIAWNGTTTLQVGETMPVRATDSTTDVSIAADSLLGVLVTLDGMDDSFAVTDMDYYPPSPPFGESFLVNCISASSFDEACFEWQYMVNGEYGNKAMNQELLEDGDVVYIFFGSPQRVSVPVNEVGVHESFVATAESYDPATDTYQVFSGDLLEAYDIGVTQPDPNNPWTPIEIATSTLSTEGTATFSITQAGIYNLNLKDISGGFYLFPATVLTVTEATSTDPGNGSGGTAPDAFDTSNAFDFLETGQAEDGSWDSELVTAWTALALATPGAPSSMKSSLASHLREEEPDFSSVRDYERHAMALMALNINPYTGGPEDYITPIVESFDGTQIEDEGLVNDDIFALFPLLHAGYDKDDEMIQKITAFIVLEQKNNGSWENSVDVTAAAIQALSELRSLPGVSSALSDAVEFLHSSQASDGGFGDPFATTWAIQGIEALGQSPESWTMGDENPLTYLAAKQQEDGGLTTNPDDYSTRAWATAYAIPAAKGLTWDDILRDFKKQNANDEDDEDKDRKEDNNSKDDADVATTTEEVLPEPEILIAEPLVATSSAPIQDGQVLGVSAHVEESVIDEVEETAEEPAMQNAPQPATVETAGAWTWVKKLFSGIWSSITGLFS